MLCVSVVDIEAVRVIQKYSVCGRGKALNFRCRCSVNRSRRRYREESDAAKT